MLNRLAPTAVICVTLLLPSCSTQVDRAPATTVNDGATPVSAASTETFITGAVRPEDLVSIPNTPWVLVSGMASKKLGTGGRLYAVDSNQGVPFEVWPGSNQHTEWDRVAYPECPGPPEDAEPHGINVSSDAGEPPVMYAINHKREAVEVFRIDSTTSTLGLVWVGCIPLPHNVYANGVAPLPDGGIALTSMFDPTEPGNPFERMFSGSDTGYVMTWHAGGDWTPVPGSGLGGANGIAVTNDGRSVIAAAWTQKKVVRMPLDGAGERVEVAVPFLPDNLRWTAQGTVLVTGQDISADDVRVCDGGEGTNCPTGYLVVEIDPETMTSTVIHDARGSGFGLATTALPVGREVWVGSIAGERIARVPVS